MEVQVISSVEVARAGVELKHDTPQRTSWEGDLCHSKFQQQG